MPADATPLRIGIVIDQLELAGTEIQFSRLAVSLAQRDCTVAMMVLGRVSPDAGALVTEMQQAGVLLDVQGRYLSARGVPGCLAAVRRWQALNNFDVVQAAMSWSGIVCGILAIRRSNRPLVSSRRSLVSERSDAGAAATMRRIAIGRSDLVIANSTAVALDSSVSEGISIGRFAVIPNMLSDSAFEKPETAIVETVYPVVVSVANLREPKGHLTLVDACRRLGLMGTRVTLVLVGEGPTHGEIGRKAAAGGVDIRFVGKVDDPRSYLARADLFVQSSYTEGSSNALMEAMAAGCGIVATDVGGTAEALSGCGELVPPRDPQALAEAMATLLESGPNREELGRRARKRAREFSPNNAAQAHITVFRDLVARC